MYKCNCKNCSIRKLICEETQKAIAEGKEPTAFCPQCPYCVGNCSNENIYNNISNCIIKNST